METVQEQNQQFLNKLKMEINNPIDEFHITLTGIREIELFYTDEYSFWNQTKQQDSGAIVNIIRIYISYLSEIKSEIIRLKNYTDLLAESQTGNLKYYTTGKIHTGNNNIPVPYIYSKTSTATFLQKYYSENYFEALVAHYYILDQELLEAPNSYNYPKPSTKIQFRGFISAYYFKKQKQLFPFRKNLEKETFQKIYDEFLEEKNSIIHKYENFISMQDEWRNEFTQAEEEARDERKKELTEFIDNKRNEFDTYLEEKKKELSDLEDLYQKKLQLEAPVEYWQKRAQKYEADGKRWLNWFIRSIAITVVILILILYFFPDVLTKSFFNGDAGAIRGIIILASILSFLVYLTKTFAKMTFSSYHLQRDAEEREQLTMVYLALEKNKNISEKERELVLQSLFSRSDYGLLTGDSSPTMPGLQGVLDKLKG